MTSQRPKHSTKVLKREALTLLQQLASDDPRRRAQSTLSVAHSLRSKLCGGRWDGEEGITDGRVGAILRALEKVGRVDNVGRKLNRAAWVALTSAERTENCRLSAERKRNRAQADRAAKALTGLGIDYRNEFGKIILTGSAAMEVLRLLPSQVLSD